MEGLFRKFDDAFGPWASLVCRLSLWLWLDRATSYLLSTKCQCGYHFDHRLRQHDFFII
jgi:hypothetical protein